MEIIGIIILAFIVFVFLGIGGLIIKAFGYIFDILMDGCTESFGCLIWVVLILIILLGLGAS